MTDTTSIRPKFITFDCYGTLTNFQMAEATTDVYGRQLAPDILATFIERFRSYRMDEILGDWKPYSEVIHNAVERTCNTVGVTFKPEDAQPIYDMVPTWGPHPDVIEGLSKIAKKIPLVILSNAMNDQIEFNVEKLEVPFFRVLTAESANAYKPQFKAFEYMFDELGCGPQDVLHCSSSFRYDLMSAYDLGIKNKCWINRRHEPACPYYEYAEVADTRGIAGLVGL